MHCPHCGYGDLLDGVQEENGVKTGTIEKLTCPECGASFKGKFWIDDQLETFKIETVRRPDQVEEI